MNDGLDTGIAARRQADARSMEETTRRDAVAAPFALILAGLAAGSSRLEGLGQGEDVEAAAMAMRALGARLERQGDGWSVTGTGNGCLLEAQATLDFGAQAGVARLVAGLVAPYAMETEISAVDASGRGAPVRDLLDPLRAMGVQILKVGEDDRLPVRLAGPRMAAPIAWRVPPHAPWVAPCLFLAALVTPGITSVVTDAGALEDTVALLRAFGVRVETTPTADGARSVAIEGQGRLAGRDLVL